MLLIIISLNLIIFKKLNLGIDFTEGTRFDIAINSLSQDMKPMDVGFLKEIISNTSLKNNFTIKELKDEKKENTQIFSILSQIQFNKDTIISEIKKISSYDYDEKKSLYQTIGPKMGSELSNSAAWSLGMAVILILFYITFRFNSLFALSSILALIHDITITIGIFSLFNLEISLPIIASFLTILGYSLNDTIVVFDRIRENLNIKKKEDIRIIVNQSINQTLRRTVLTSLTTLIVLIILYFVGSYLIKLFTLALIIGVIIGTYSSIYIASFSFTILYEKYGWMLNTNDEEEDGD
tara:strand:- start:1140 stop:2024 length:885 start_codon:yes stop_codon:yes gene_type:complete